MEDKAASKYGFAVGAGSLIGTALALFMAKKAQAAPSDGGMVSLDEAAMSALLAIAQNTLLLDDITGNTEQTNVLLDQIAKILGAPGGAAANPSSFICFTITQPIPGSPLVLPDYPIPFGLKVVIKALHSNTGLVYLARSEGECLLPGSRYYLNKNETIEYQLDTTKRVYMDAVNVNDGIVCTVEQKGATGG